MLPFLLPFFFLLVPQLSQSTADLGYAPPGEVVSTHENANAHLGSSSFAECPLTCSCTLTTVDCAGGRLTTFLTKLPEQIMHLNLFDNDLTSLPSNFFQQHQYPALRSIDFRNNSLTTIEAGTFTNLPALTTLYLSYNDIKTIEPGAFGDALPALTTIRLDHNSIERLEKNTFHSLPMLAIVRLRANPLHTIVPGTFQSLPSLRRIEMNGTLTNASMLGSYDQGTGVSTITFAPDCLALQYLELGRLRLTSLYPNYFHSDEFFGIINRIGAREIYSTDIAECDRLNGGAVFSELFGAIVCSMGNGNRLSDSLSRREKNHLGQG